MVLGVVRFYQFKRFYIGKNMLFPITTTNVFGFKILYKYKDKYIFFFKDKNQEDLNYFVRVKAIKWTRLPLTFFLNFL